MTELNVTVLEAYLASLLWGPVKVHGLSRLGEPLQAGAIKGYGTITREEWQADGSLVAVVEMPAGLYGPFVERLGKITQGTIQTKVMK